MKPIVIDKNTLLGQYLMEWGNLNGQHVIDSEGGTVVFMTDSCSILTSFLIKAPLMLLLTIFLGSAVTVVMIGFPLAGLISGCLTASECTPGEAWVGIALWIFIGVLWALESIKSAWYRHKDEERSRPVSPTRQLFRSWRDKFCVPVKIK